MNKTENKLLKEIRKEKEYHKNDETFNISKLTQERLYKKAEMLGISIDEALELSVAITSLTIVMDRLDKE